MFLYPIFANAHAREIISPQDDKINNKFISPGISFMLARFAQNSLEIRSNCIYNSIMIRLV